MPRPGQTRAAEGISPCPLDGKSSRAWPSFASGAGGKLPSCLNKQTDEIAPTSGASHTPVLCNIPSDVIQDMQDHFSKSMKSNEVDTFSDVIQARWELEVGEPSKQDRAQIVRVDRRTC